MQTEVVDIETKITPNGQDNEVEVTAEVQLWENGEHEVLSVVDGDNKELLKTLSDLDEKTIIDKAEAKATIPLRY